ncbi:MAG: hypothetical protein ACLFVL_00065 [Candidatus Aenigmatarchaeota archaeon]
MCGRWGGPEGVELDLKSVGRVVDWLRKRRTGGNSWLIQRIIRNQTLYFREDVREV